MFVILSKIYIVSCDITIYWSGEMEHVVVRNLQRNCGRKLSHYVRDVVGLSLVIFGE